MEIKRETVVATQIVEKADDKMANRSSLGAGANHTPVTPCGC